MTKMNRSVSLKKSLLAIALGSLFNFGFLLLAIKIKRYTGKHLPHIILIVMQIKVKRCGTKKTVDKLVAK